MISLHENHLPSPPPPAEELFKAMQKTLAEKHQNYVNSEFRKAIIAKCGTLPSVEEMAARGKCFITPEGVFMLAWDHPPIELGTKVDKSYVIATVGPPKI